MEASPLARRAPLGTLKPGRVSPMRAVPEHIERPEYMFHDGPERVTASDIKTPETIAKIREAGRIAAGAIEAVGAAIAPGVTTEELDRIGHEYLIAHDAYPSCLGYMGFPKSICSSINEVICHGIPDDRPLEDGDLSHRWHPRLQGRRPRRHLRHVRGRHRGRGIAPARRAHQERNDAWH